METYECLHCGWTSDIDDLVSLLVPWQDLRCPECGSMDIQSDEQDDEEIDHEWP